MSSSPWLTVILRADSAVGLYRCLNAIERAEGLAVRVVDSGADRAAAAVIRDWSGRIESSLTGGLDAMIESAQSFQTDWVMICDSDHALIPEALPGAGDREAADILHGGALHPDGEDSQEPAFPPQSALFRGQYADLLERKADLDATLWGFYARAEAKGLRFRDIGCALTDAQPGSPADAPGRLARSILPEAIRRYGWRSPGLIPRFLKTLAADR